MTAQEQHFPLDANGLSAPMRDALTRARQGSRLTRYGDMWGVAGDKDWRVPNSVILALVRRNLLVPCLEATSAQGRTYVLQYETP